LYLIIIVVLKQLPGDILGTTTSLEILPNGYLAYLGGNKIIRFLDSQNDFYDISSINKTFIVTGQDRAQLKLLSNNRLATPSTDKTLKIWNITDYKLVQTLNMKISVDINRNCFARLSDDLLAGAGYNQSIIEIWNLTNYKLVKEIDFKDKLVVSVTSLINRYLVIGLNNNSINIININDYLLFNQIQLESIPLQLACLPNEDLVAITSNGNIYVLDLINNQIKTNFSTEITNIQSLEVINDKYIAVGETGYLRIYDLINKQLAIKKEIFTNRFNNIFSIKYIKNGNYLVHIQAQDLKNILIWKIFF
jgi:WD40 repeat protein